LKMYSKNLTIFSFSPTDKPRAKLTKGPTTIPVGGSVTLSCSVEPSAGWKYRWFRKTSDTSEVQIRTNNGENRYITVAQGGIYRCEGVRGNPAFTSNPSRDVTIKITFSNKVVVTRRPNWPEMFSGETITLTCEVQGGETTEWTYEWKRPGLATHRTNSKDWTFIVSQSSSGDYMCQCKLRDDRYSSTQRSNAITLSVSVNSLTGKPKAQLDRNNAELPPGGRVTLTCTVNSLSSFSYTSSSSSAWKYVWYRGENCSELLTGEEAVFPSNGEINVSEEGLHWCRGKRGQPVYYTILSDPISIVLPVTVSSQLPVMLIIGIIIGIALIILLILWWRYRRSK
uniref:Ig-like domain-containing protein n=1 Tax=Poecilia formosa TaxID=48698 RepID=A0A096MBD1_POEFO